MEQKETVNAMLKMLAVPEKVDAATQTVVVAQTPSSPVPSEVGSPDLDLEEGELPHSPEGEEIEDPLWDMWASPEAPVHSPFQTPPRQISTLIRPRAPFKQAKRRMSFKSLRNIKKASYNGQHWFFE